MDRLVRRVDRVRFFLEKVSDSDKRCPHCYASAQGSGVAGGKKRTVVMDVWFVLVDDAGIAFVLCSRRINAGVRRERC